MPFMRGEGACPSALSRAPGFGVHRSAAQTLDRRSGRIRRRVCAGRAVRPIHGKQTIWENTIRSVKADPRLESFPP
ncbi:MAG: hypothetical protein JWO71_3435 [Candidatus Acidoferrum typicum]|nr:hypothetical protein [Candidatus Acidoferrum typicum]